MKRIFVAAIGCMMLSSLALAQNVKSIGTSGSAGYYSMTIRDNASAVGDTGTFNDGVHTQTTTIWKSNFMFYDGTTTWWADGDAPHSANLVTAGTPTNADAQNFTNTFTFPGNANLSASLAIVLSQPVVNNVVKVNYTWTFSNASASPINLRMVWLHDGDNYIVDNYDADIVAFVDSTNNTLGAIAQGETNGAGGIDMDSSVLIDTSTQPDALLGIGGTNGPGNWWLNLGGWADQNGATASNGIPVTYRNKIMNDLDVNVDADGNDVADAGGDVGGVIQWAVVVPASGNTQIIHSATYGLDTDVAPNGWAGNTEVSDWTLF